MNHTYVLKSSNSNKVVKQCTCCHAVMIDNNTSVRYEKQGKTLIEEPICKK